MHRHSIVAIAFTIVSSIVGANAPAQERTDPAALVEAQRTAMSVLAPMDGVWRGPAWTLLASGQKREITQTERIGPFLDGSLKVIEGRGYEADGRATFNALGVVSYDVASQKYTLRSYAQGRGGDFAFRPTTDGYAWDIVMPNATIHYVATIRDGTLRSGRPRRAGTRCGPHLRDDAPTRGRQRLAGGRPGPAALIRTTRRP